MVRDYLVSLGAGSLMVAMWSTCGWLLAPEPAELRLARIQAAALSQSVPVRTLPPEVNAIRCMMVWIGTAGPELWCPAAPPRPRDQAPAAVPTS
jgi:hypothetical protein